MCCNLVFLYLYFIISCLIIKYCLIIKCVAIAVCNNLEHVLALWGNILLFILRKVFQMCPLDHMKKAKNVSPNQN